MFFCNSKNTIFVILFNLIFLFIMKKMYFFAAFMLLASFSFAQFSSRQNATNGTNTKVKAHLETPASAYTGRATWFSEDFESGNLDSWTTSDEDGDQNDWGIRAAAAGGGFNSDNCATSASWDGGILTPENWLISPAIDLTTATGTITLDYQVSAQDPAWEYEKYKLVVSTTDNAVGSFLTDALYEETLPQVGTVIEWGIRSVNLSDYVGETIYLAWVHYDCTNMYFLNIDDIIVYENTVIDAGITAAVAPDNGGGCLLTDTEDVTVTIFNYGGQDITTIDVSYDVDGMNTVTETAAITIAPGASADYTFTQTVDLSVLGYYTMNFGIALTDDANTNNNTYTKKVSSTDAKFTVHSFSDSQGSQEWTFTNSNGDVVAMGGDYQWAVEDAIDVCVIADDCYTFNFSGFDASGWIEVLYNGTVVAGNQSAGNAEGGVEFFSLADGCAAIDAKAVKVNIPNYAVPGDVNIGGTVQNLGADELNSFDVTYNIDGGVESAVFSVSGLTLATGESYDFTHDVAANSSCKVFKNHMTRNFNVNGGVDANMADNMASKDILISTAMVPRHMIFENFTTAVCPNCPPVIASTEEYATNNPNAILIALHSGYYTDDMTTDESEELMEFYNDNGTYAPALMIDRIFYTEGLAGTPDPGPVFWPAEDMAATTARLDARLAEPSFVSVALDATLSATGMIDVSVSGEILADQAGTDLRVVVYFLENGLLYSQSGQSVDPFTHNDVLRKAIPSTYGAQGSVSANTAGTTFSHVYSQQVDPSWDPTEMLIVAFVANYDAGNVNNREILNAVEIHMPPAAVSVDNVASSFGIYPNPANNYVKVTGAENATIEITSITGQVVLTQTLKGNYVNISELSEGHYMIKVTDGTNTSVQKVVVKR